MILRDRNQAHAPDSVPVAANQTTAAPKLATHCVHRVPVDKPCSKCEYGTYRPKRAGKHDDDD